MTYTAGSLIQPTDYNGFVSTTAGSNINDVWGTGSGDKGWGQTALATVASTNTITATQWAGLVNTLASMGSQTNTTLTSRTAPVAGNTISILANVATDITSCTTNRGSAAASGTTSSTWTGNVAKTTATGSGVSSWTIRWYSTVTFPSADQARYFWNAGGLVRIDMSKTSTGTDSDPDWNSFISSIGTLYFSGRVNSSAQTIAGTNYTGFTRVGGTGTPSTNLTTQGWYVFTPGAANTTVFKIFNSATGYTSDYVQVDATVSADSTQLLIVTTWYDAGASGAGKNRQISGGTDTTSPYSAFGTAPAVLCRFVPPSTTYLTNSWGTPTVASNLGPTAVDLLVVAGGGGAGGGYVSGGYSAGGGGAGGMRTGSFSPDSGTTYTVTVGGGGNGGLGYPGGGQPGNSGSNSAFGSVTCSGGGGGGGYNYVAGSNGGSGGGSGADLYNAGAAGNGTSGQGSAGGQASVAYGMGGGGGGAGAAGANGPATFASNGASGGNGLANAITGSSVTYAGGGGGSAYITGGYNNGSGGTGGGGGGNAANSAAGVNGTNNLGGGGGATGGDSLYGINTGGSGGSGVVVIRYANTFPDAYSTTGSPTLTNTGGYKIYKWTGSGSITW